MAEAAYVAQEPVAGGLKFARWDIGDTFEVYNPATGEVVGRVSDMTVKQVRDRIEQAEQALPAWRDRTAKERSVVLRRWFELIMENQDDLAHLMTAEQGKPLAEARGEVAYGASFIEWFGEEAKRTYGETIPHHAHGKRLLVIKQAVGVCAAITPWNFPIAMITRKAGPALAAGCTMVVRPASETPLCALAIADLAKEAGVPDGVLSVVTSRKASEVGRELTTNPIVRKVSFTGSTEIGKILMEQASGTVKRLSLELGGNAPFIVFDDADLDAAVAGAIASKYRNAGQTCICANRLYVQDGVYDAFAEKFSAAVAKLKVGTGLEEGVEVGPLVNQDALQKVKQIVGSALASGAKAAVGGHRHERGGLFYAPTVLTDVKQSMKITQSEIFGPVAPLFRFSTDEEAIQQANDTPFGLAAYFYAKDSARIWKVLEGLDYGMVGVNEGIISTEVAPFGGVKESGIGREGSSHGIDEYLEMKYVCISIS